LPPKTTASPASEPVPAAEGIGRGVEVDYTARMKILKAFQTAVFALCFCAVINCKAQTSAQSQTNWQADYLKKFKEQILLPPKIVSFIASKEKQAGEIAAKNGFDLSAGFKTFFAAAEAGRARQAEEISFGLFKDTNSPAYKTPLRQAIADSQLAYENFAKSDSELVMMLAKDFMDSLPANCIYFGGTGVGRGLPTAFCRAPGDPIFVLTQNQLCDSRYIQYVRDLYGSRINLPAPDEVKVPASGQMVVMQTNALIAKAIFDKNPDREFYYEKSFALDWMYPYLTPHGALLKLNRSPQESISTNDVTRDMEFWSGKIKQLQDKPRFATDETRVIYSHLRSSIADVYAWRMQKAKSPGERQRMTQAAEQAYNQSMELFPGGIEAVSGYVNVELWLGNSEAALNALRKALAVSDNDYENTNVKGRLQDMIERIEKFTAKPATAK
jgi:hypothetical protein